MSLCLHVNNLKYQKAVYIPASVTDKYIDEGSRSPTTYHLDVTLLSGKRMNLQVAEQDYNKTFKGSTIHVAEHKGLLGITTAEVAD